jgi:hypothetical protein
MFETAQFFRICVESLQKVPFFITYFLVKNIIIGIKNAEIYADLNSLMPTETNAP